MTVDKVLRDIDNGPFACSTAYDTQPAEHLTVEGAVAAHRADLLVGKFDIEHGRQVAGGHMGLAEKPSGLGGAAGSRHEVVGSDPDAYTAGSASIRGVV